jgi:hypothetical protein
VFARVVIGAAQGIVKAYDMEESHLLKQTMGIFTTLAHEVRSAKSHHNKKQI